jgi:ATP-binding cassette, subfamily F, member 3
MIEKFRAKASKAKFAQSLIKKLDKVELIEVDDDDNSAIRFRFPPAPRSGLAVVSAEKLDKSYGPKEVLRKINLVVQRGEKIAFVGRNGEGKSTLSKMIAGVTEISGGKLELGANVQIGYYAQDQADKLDGEKTVFATLDDVATGEMRTRVRNLLGCFLFSGEDVDKKVKVLSGGEKSRLALARLLLDPINLLVLDEPTNHLDLRSKAVLKEALQQFDGTLLVVSHDRDFLRGLTDRVYEFRDGGIKEFIGDIYEYLESKKLTDMRAYEESLLRPAAPSGAGNGQKSAAKQPEQPSGNATQTPGRGAGAPRESSPTPAPKMNPQEWNQARKELEKEEKNLRRLVEKHEKTIGELEAALAAVEEQLRDPAFFRQADPAVLNTYESNKTELAAAMQAWEEAAEKAEAAVKARNLLQDRKPDQGA